MVVVSQKMERQGVFVKTFGCQMNVYESFKMVSILEREGFFEVSSLDDADVILINTCVVRKKAEDKAKTYIGRLKKYKDRGKIIGVCGCMSQLFGKRLMERFPHIDFVIGTRNFSMVWEAVKRANLGERSVFLDMCDDVGVVFPSHVKEKLTSPKAFVTIMEGCNNFCSYCIVPYVRGREISRPAYDILDEIRRVCEKGVKEIILLGQNVNSYRFSDIDFPKLLHLVEEIEEVKRIRFVTSHPKDLSDKLIDCFSSMEKLCPHLHLPIQSGSDRILKLMRRGYSVRDYVKKIEKLRKVSPSISLSTDIIVGFPTETEEDFNMSLSVIKEVQYDEIFSFCYSDRPFVKSKELYPKVPKDVAKSRLYVLQSLQKEISDRKRRLRKGEICYVLLEGESKKGDLFTGRDPFNMVVNFDKKESLKVGDIVKVKIVEVLPHSFLGEVVS